MIEKGGHYYLVSKNYDWVKPMELVTVRIYEPNKLVLVSTVHNGNFGYVDPPSGWMYGFPALLQKDYRQQLIDAGYPKKDIELALKHSRYWEIEE